MILLLISFLAGALTLLSPCILPILPVIVGGSLTSDGSVEERHQKTWIIILSLSLSVILFTLILKASTALLGIPEIVWKIVSGGIVLLFGVVLVFPSLWERLGFVSKANAVSQTALATGYKSRRWWREILMGAALGPIFTTCSPTYFIILATVLPASFGKGMLYLFAYALGLGLLLYLVSILGDRLVRKLAPLSDSRGWLKRAVGVLMILVGVFVITGYDKKIETALIDAGFNPISIEESLLQKANLEDDSKEEIEILNSTLERRGLAPELVRPQGFINTGGQPVALEQYRGKVVLLEFWTYSCINCQRVIPYLNEWYTAYEDDGLVILGVHTPEFAFEKKFENVQEAVRDFGIEFPVALDNEYETWRAYDNHYWPRKYLIDQEGYIVYDHIGEGAYEETERAIQTLLGLNESTRASGVSSSRSGSYDRTGEIYFGSDRNQFVVNARKVPGTYDLVSTGESDIELEGRWILQGEYAEASGNTSVIHLGFEGKKAYLVLASDLPTSVQVVAGDTVYDVSVSDQTLYDIVEFEEPGTHSVEIHLPSGVQVYTAVFE